MLIVLMALPANSWPFLSNFWIPPFHTDSHPCIRKGGPVDCIGDPVNIFESSGCTYFRHDKTRRCFSFSWLLNAFWFSFFAGRGINYSKWLINDYGWIPILFGLFLELPKMWQKTTPGSWFIKEILQKIKEDVWENI